MQGYESVRYGDPAANYQTQMQNSLMRQEGECTAGTGNVYTGARDPNGYRNGQGSFKFADGSAYNGDWQQGLRHGIGEFTYKDGSVYKGQWIHDLKHGMGKFTYTNGDVVVGTWVHDRLNGVAKRTLKGHSEPEEVIYKDDMLI